MRWLLLTALLLCSCSTPITSTRLTAEAEATAKAQLRSSQGQGVGTSSMPIFVICVQQIARDGQDSNCLRPGNKAVDELHHAIDHGMAN